MSQEKAQLIAPQGHFTVPGLNVAGVVTASSFSGNCTGTASSIVKGTNVVVGVMTASSFVGDVTGNVTGIGSNTDNLHVGVVTATSFAGNFTGIGSGLTGTPNVVAGVVTATKFVGNTPGTVSKLADGTNINVGVVTATKFVGNTPGLAAGIAAAQNINVGVLTATGGLYGDGSGLTGAGSTAYIRQTVGSGTTIDLNNGNIINLLHIGNNSTVSFANTTTSNDVTIIRPLDLASEAFTSGAVTFDGNDYLNCAHADLALGTGNFTLEFWVNQSSRDGNYVIDTRTNASATDGFSIYFNSDGQPLGYVSGASGFFTGGGETIALNTWNHIAIVRDATSSMKCYVNGVKSGATFTGTQDWTNGRLAVGAEDATTGKFQGSVSNVRLVKGTALYTHQFTPPLAELTNVTNTELLCCQSDSSTTTAAVSPASLTTGGDPTASSVSIYPPVASSFTWPSGITWNGGSAPTLISNPRSNAGQVFNLVTSDGGSTWYGYEEVNSNPINYKLYTWGANSQGEGGHNNVVRYSSPVQVGTESIWLKLPRKESRRAYHNLALQQDGTLWTWGSNETGVLGLNSDGDHRSSPVQIPGTWGTDAFMMVGNATNHVIKTDGTLWAWGYNPFGMLGQNNRTDYSSPVQIPGTTWSVVSSGTQNIGTVAAVKTDGTLWSWGYAGYGQLGNNDRTRRSSPVQVPGTTWNNVSVSDRNVHATKTDGTLWVWGTNGYGQLAQNNDGPSGGKSSPVQIPGTNWTGDLASGQGLLGAIRGDGTLWLWGQNESGNIGQNEPSSNQNHRSSPVQVPGTTWDELSMTGRSCMAIKTDGTVWGWGNNDQGNLGQNDVVSRSSPVQIPGTWDAINSGGYGASMGLKL